MPEKHKLGSNNREVTICDIAAKLGISASAVSQALKGTGRIGNETRERVRKIAGEMGYRPSLVARSLVTQRTSTIGVVVPVMGDTHYSRMLDGIESVVSKRGYNVILCSFNSDYGCTEDSYHSLLNRRVEGIITAPLFTDTSYQQTIQVLLGLEARGFPVVVLDQNNLDPGLSTVSSDNYSGAKKMAEHLISLGHKRIGYLQVDVSRHDRENGFKDAMYEAGLEVDEPVFASIRTTGPRDSDPVIESFAQYMRDAGKPTAVFVTCDMLAIKIIRACHVLNIRVPEDLAVVGYDDILTSEHTIPSLTTVHQPAFEMGVRAAEVLFDRIAGRLDKHVNVVLKSRLVIRESCGADISARGKALLE